jgi:hypothetical protein
MVRERAADSPADSATSVGTITAKSAA